MIKNLPDWIEAGSMMFLAVVGVASTSAIALYRLDTVEDKVDEVYNIVSEFRVVRQQVDELKSHDEKVLEIFSKFTDSVDRLNVTVAKLETKVELMEKK